MKGPARSPIPDTWASAGTDFTETVGNLTNGTEYTFELRAVNSVGPGPATSVTATPHPPPRRQPVTTPSVTAPSTLQDLEAESGDGQVVLTWDGPSSNGGKTITGYEYRHYEGTGTTVPDPTWASAGTDLTETVGTLTNGTEYTFELRAENSVGPGPATSVTATPSAPATPPGTLQDLEADLEAESGDGQVVLMWTAPSSDGGETITGYEYRYHEGTGPVPDSVTWSSAGTDLTETVDTLTNGTEYTFELRAENSVGPGPATSVTATPSAPATPPGTLQDLEAESGDGQVVLMWTAPSSTGGETITGYEYRYHEGTGPVPDSVTWSSAGTDLTETVDTLTNGTAYTFELRAENSVGPGPATSVTATPSAPATPPGTLQDLEAESGDGQVVLMWTAPSSTGGETITGYEYRYHEGTGPVPDSVTWSSAGTDLTETVDTLTNGTAYTFELRAENSVGPGPATSVTATPSAPATPPGTLQDLEAESGDGQVVLMWTAPLSDGGETITGYEYRYHEGTGPIPDSVTWSSAGTDLTETVDMLTNGTAYTFELRAVEQRRPRAGDIGHRHAQRPGHNAGRGSRREPHHRPG